MLFDDLKARLKQAMKERDAVAREVLRVAVGDLQTQEARGDTIDDQAVEKVLRKLVKSNGETIAAAEDDAQKATLRRENEVLEALLPQTLDVEGIIAALADEREAIVAAGNDGQATGVAMKALKRQGAAVQGKDVSIAVRQIRSS
ncbi:MAG: GatB/YqeY domain-containing protein [Myxococcota bacterium]